MGWYILTFFVGAVVGMVITIILGMAADDIFRED